MIVAASTTLPADSRSGGRGGVLPWALVVVGSLASLAANVAVVEPTATGRVIAAWPSFALIAAYELLMHVRHSARGGVDLPERSPGLQPSRREAVVGPVPGAARSLRRQAWLWAQDNRAADGSLPSGREIARQYGRHERRGRLVKRSGCAGEFAIGNQPAPRLVEHQAAAATNR
jgi:hypothetical protein